MRRTATVALTLALVVVLGLVMLRSQRAAPDRVVDTGAPEVPRVAGDSQAPDEPFDIAGSSSAREPAVRDAVPSRPATLLVRVSDRRSGEALEGTSIALEAETKPGPESDPDPVLSNRPGEVDARTDARGEALLEAPSGIRMRLRVSGTGPEIGGRTLPVPALAPEEQREMSVDLPAGLDLEFWVRVVSAERGDPIEGAQVRLFAGGPAISSRADVPRKKLFSQVSTDPEGLAQIRVSSWKSVLARVDADGFGPVLAAVVEGHEERDRAQVLRLLRSASLSAVVLSSRGDPLPGVTVALAAPSDRIARPEGAALLGNDPEWSALTDAEGRCGVEGLPAEAPLRVEVRRGEELLLEVAEPLVLAPGEDAQRTWCIGTGARLSGLLLDPDSQPMPQVEIWLSRAPSGSASEPIDRYFQPGIPEDTFATARTDSRGRFVLEDVASGDWWIGPAALPPADDEPAKDAIATRAVGVRIPPDTPEIELVLRAHLGIYVRGHVVGVDGSGVAHAFVHASPEDAAGILSVRSGEDGAFALGPLAPGLLRLQASGRAGMADSEPVTVRSGDPDVVLRLAPGAILRGRVYDQSTGAPCAATVMLGADTDGRLKVASAGREAAFEFRGLRAGTYDLVARSDDGRIGILRGVAVRAGPENPRAAIALAPGARLRIRYLGQPGWGHFAVSSEGTAVAVESVRSGTSALLAVPAGRLLVRFTIADGAHEEREIEVEAGEEEIELVFRSN